jgi:serine/threonine protein kinase
MIPNSPPPAQIRLLREVAAGPMSAVYVAIYPRRTGDELVVLKVLRDSDTQKLDRLFDIRDEARALSRIGHRRVVAATDLALVGNNIALVSPFIDGIDLLDLIDVLNEMDTVMPRRVTCEIIRQVASTIQACLVEVPWDRDEPLRRVHRDIKPSNILITRDGGVRVTDFGTGYTVLAGRAARTGTLKKGLIRYLSPERREGHRGAATGDIYALGIVTLEMLRGKWLRRTRSQNPAHDRQIADVVARLGDLNMRSDSDDRTFRNLLLRMVAFEPDARPDIDEVVTTFRALADRTEGPSLETFAPSNVRPWLEKVPTECTIKLQGTVARIVEREDDPDAFGKNQKRFDMARGPHRYALQAESSVETGAWAIDTGEFTSVTPAKLGIDLSKFGHASRLVGSASVPGTSPGQDDVTEDAPVAHIAFTPVDTVTPEIAPKAAPEIAPEAAPLRPTELEPSTISPFTYGVIALLSACVLLVVGAAGGALLTLALTMM